jgi:hypothetical protein
MNRRYYFLQGFVYLLGKLTVEDVHCAVVVVHESVEGPYDVASVYEKNVAGNNQHELKGFHCRPIFSIS